MKRYRFSPTFRKVLRARMQHLVENRPEGLVRAAFDFSRQIPGDGTDVINAFSSANTPWFSRGHSAWRGRDL